MRSVSVIFLVTAFTVIQLNAQQTWSLKECIDYALEHSKDITIARLNIESRKLDYRDGISGLLPGLSPGTGYRLYSGKAVDPNTNDIIERQFFSNSYSLSSSFTLFNGFRQYNRILFEKLNYEIEKDRMDQVGNELIYAIIDAYIDCLLSAGMKDIQQEQLDLSNREYGKTKKMIELGITAGADLYEIHASLSRDEFLMLQYENQLKTNLNRLKQLMNLPVDSTINVKLPEFEFMNYSIPEFENVYETALENSPEIHILKKELLAARTSTGIARGSFWPSVSFSAGWSTGYYETNTDDSGVIIPFREQFNKNRYFSYGAYLSFPVFTSLNRKHQIQQSKINEEIKAANLDKNISLFRHDLQDVIMQAESALSEYNAANNQFYSDTKAFKAAGQKWDKGLISIMDYYESRNNLARSKVEVLRTELQVFLNETTLRFYTTGSYKY